MMTLWPVEKTLVSAPLTTSPFLYRFAYALAVTLIERCAPDAEHPDTLNGQNDCSAEGCGGVHDGEKHLKVSPFWALHGHLPHRASAEWGEEGGGLL